MVFNRRPRIDANQAVGLKLNEVGFQKHILKLKIEDVKQPVFRLLAT